MNSEKRVRAALTEEFCMPFREKRLETGRTISGEPAFKKFDAVSSNSKIIAMVKDLSAENRAGNKTRHARVIRDLYYLALAHAEKRFMYLSPVFYEWLRMQKDVPIPQNVAVRLIPEDDVAMAANLNGCSFRPKYPDRKIQPIVCESTFHQGKAYLYWWDIWETRKESLKEVGEIHFVEKDTGRGFAVVADDLLPLLAEERRTTRMRSKTGGNWGIRVLASKPDQLVIETPGVSPEQWQIISAKRLQRAFTVPMSYSSSHNLV